MPKSSDPFSEIHQLLIEGSARLDAMEMAMDKMGDNVSNQAQAKLGDMMHGAMSVGTAAMDAKLKEVDAKLAAQNETTMQQLEKCRQLVDRVEQVLQAVSLGIEAMKATPKARSKVGILHLPTGPIKMEMTEQ